MLDANDVAALLLMTLEANPSSACVTALSRRLCSPSCEAAAADACELISRAALALAEPAARASAPLAPAEGSELCQRMRALLFAVCDALTHVWRTRRRAAAEGTLPAELPFSGLCRWIGGAVGAVVGATAAVAAAVSASASASARQTGQSPEHQAAAGSAGGGACQALEALSSVVELWTSSAREAGAEKLVAGGQAPAGPASDPGSAGLASFPLSLDSLSGMDRLVKQASLPASFGGFAASFLPALPPPLPRLGALQPLPPPHWLLAVLIDGAKPHEVTQTPWSRSQHPPAHPVHQTRPMAPATAPAPAPAAFAAAPAPAAYAAASAAASAAPAALKPSRSRWGSLAGGDPPPSSAAAVSPMVAQPHEASSGSSSNGSSGSGSGSSNGGSGSGRWGSVATDPPAAPPVQAHALANAAAVANAAATATASMPVAASVWQTQSASGHSPGPAPARHSRFDAVPAGRLAEEVASADRCEARPAPWFPLDNTAPPAPRAAQQEEGRISALVNRFLGETARVDRRARRRRIVKRAALLAERNEAVAAGSAVDSAPAEPVRALPFDAFEPLFVGLPTARAAAAAAAAAGAGGRSAAGTEDAEEEEEAEAQRMAADALREADAKAGRHGADDVGRAARAALQEMEARRAFPARAGLGMTAADMAALAAASATDPGGDRASGGATAVAAASAAVAAAGAAEESDAEAFERWRRAKAGVYRDRVIAYVGSKRARARAPQ